MHSLTIDDRFRLFSKEPGVKCPIPYIEQGIQIFPCALKLLNSDDWIALNIQGPVSDFATFLDLERGIIQVMGKGNGNQFRYYLFSKENKLHFFQDRGTSVLPKEHFFQVANKLPLPKIHERLSLGLSKKLDWRLVLRRSDLREILPLWFYIGQMFSLSQVSINTPSLLNELINKTINENYLNLFFAGFSGIFYPQSQDENHLGFSLDPVSFNENPFSILSVGYQKIRAELIVEESLTLTILPSFLSRFPVGKAIGLKVSFGSIDIEWTKGRIRQMIFHVETPGCYKLKFPKNHKSCRFIKPDGSKAQLAFDCDVTLRAGRYFFTHFQG